MTVSDITGQWLIDPSRSEALKRAAEVLRVEPMLNEAKARELFVESLKRSALIDGHIASLSEYALHLQSLREPVLHIRPLPQPDLHIRRAEEEERARLRVRDQWEKDKAQALPPAVVPAAQTEPAAPKPTKETTAQRNDRWLGEVDIEERTGPKVGAQARAIRRIVADDSESEHKVKKGIQAAKAERAKKYREGGVATLPGKKARPATPFDGLKKRT